MDYLGPLQAPYYFAAGVLAMRYAIFVDAGYLYAEASKPLSASGSDRMERRYIVLDQAEIIGKLLETASAKTDDAALLRIYWYDGVRGGELAPEQIELALTPDVKFRAGVVNAAGQQKGVDSLIVTDLIELSRNHAISDAVLLSGDGDLRIAIQIAQSFGVRVHLISIEPPNRGAQSRSQLLAQEADTITEWSRADSLKLVALKPGIDADAVSDARATQIANDVEDALGQAANELLVSLDPDQRRAIAVLEPGVLIPSEYDSRLLIVGSGKLEGRRLERAEITYLRNRFKELARGNAASETG